ncbi:MAG: 6-pyruvoyltetrahydropterin synthase [Nitrospirales bacterium]|nr:MAG: 6-pyruvoyltetrahydropterin synthase [Nitrospirales bacterium]
MSKATLTKRTEFCSSHRYHNPNWDDAKNKAVFGPCNNQNSHGHNYLLEVTLCGPIDPVNGMIINLYDLKIYLWDVLKEFDHKNLNLDTPYFTERIPTTENLAVTLWECLKQHPHMPPVDRIRLHEDHTLFADVTAELLNGPGQSSHADITRRYKLSAAKHLPNGQTTGHNYTVDVTVTGPIASDTGQVVNLGLLDQIVNEKILTRFNGKNISKDEAFQETSPCESHLAQVMWHALNNEIAGTTLTQITVSEGTDSQASYRG